MECLKLYDYPMNTLFRLRIYSTTSLTIKIDTCAFVILLLVLVVHEIKFMISHRFNSIGSRKITQLQISPDFLQWSD